MSPDGTPRLVMAINGQYPGPTLYADWGDTMQVRRSNEDLANHLAYVLTQVTVKNSLQHNGTSIHWHGIRMLNSCQHDGVNGMLRMVEGISLC